MRLGGSWPCEAVVVVVMEWGSGSMWFVWWCSCRRMDTVWKMDELEGSGVLVYVDPGGECLLYQMMMVSRRIGFGILV